MKITYNENPLLTTVELDAQDREIFWLKLKVDELGGRLFGVHFSLTCEPHVDLEEAKRKADPKYYYDEGDGEKTAIDKRVDRLLESFTEELLGSHCGDCTSVACSCIKCIAEDILGIDTVKHFHGRVLHLIGGAFGKGRSIGEALDYLENHKIDRQKPESWRNSTQEEYERHIPGWEEKQRKAYEGLRQYAKEHAFI